MKKKNILNVILIIIITFLTLKVYAVFNNKQPLGSSLVTLHEDNESRDDTVYSSAKYNIVTINFDSLSGSEKPDSTGLTIIDAVTIDALKCCPDFKMEKPSGSITVQLINDDYDVVKSFTSDSNKKISKTFLIKSGGNYKIHVISNGFHGMYNLRGTNYPVF